MDYHFKEIENLSKQKWEKLRVYRTKDKIEDKIPKCYVLDMFPYPSGAGLHVGHPLGYIASDIFSRYKRHCGYNVLHPMGFDAFGLPAEQYAIQTGQHPSITTQKNIQRYREQLNKIGLSYDWDREVITSDPRYYKWTQWIFIQLFNSWYDKKDNKAKPIELLVKEFEANGNRNVSAFCDKVNIFSAEEWKGYTDKQKSDILMKYRLAYYGESYVNWCPALGTVLANDEVRDGVSERGGYPVERKLMPQWSLRITAYAERLLEGLEKLDWSESIKESQRNWIGKSEGAEIRFSLPDGEAIVVFTTRPDTIFGVTYLVLAPEHPLAEKVSLKEYLPQIQEYINYAKNRSERERQSDVNKVTGVFTGSYAIHPFTKQEIPIWIADYVLYHYGTGAVMAVPAHDSRDFRFAKHFNLPIRQVIQAPKGWDINEKSYDEKTGKCIHSDFINGLEVTEAIQKVIEEVEKRNIGKRVVNYKLRDAVFGRQRYWGEPIPIYYDENNIPHALDEKDLPLELPDVDKYLPTATGEPPLARAVNWKYKNRYEYEKTTMPGWAGSSWYFLRYMDPHNRQTFADKKITDYWNKVDVYVGGSEHATGHLLYARFWTKFLYDLGYINFDEPFQKLINQGMILGNSALVYQFNVIFNSKDKTADDECMVFLSDDFIQTHFPEIISEHDEVKKEEYIKKLHQFLNDIIFKLKLTDRSFSIQHIGTGTYIHVDVNFVDNEDFIHVEKNKLPFPLVQYSNDIPSVLDDIRELFYDGFYVYLYYIPFRIKDKEIKRANIILTQTKSKIKCKREIEKMSKSKWNVLNPDDIIDQYGADAFRLYEMFLGPIEQHKPFILNGITGTYNFLKKFLRLYFSGDKINLSDEKPTLEEYKIFHKTIKKVREDIEKFSFNTCVSSLMILVNKLAELKTNKREILEPLVVLISPFAPHIAEYLWTEIGHSDSVVDAPYPSYAEEYVIDDTFNYPISFNGKTRFNLEIPLNIPKEQVEQLVLSNALTQKYLNNNKPKKFIFVEKKIVNIVL